MSQFPSLSKSKTRDPPPVLFLHPSPAASHASLPGILPSAPTSGGTPGSQQPQSGTSSLGRTGSILGMRDAAVASTAANLTKVESASRRTGGMMGSQRTATTATTTNNNGGGLTAGMIPGMGGGLPPQLLRASSTRATDRTDALWAEMQATLEEVELSASGGTRVFGADHDRKLGELRAAQIALAQAWARSEADEAIETMGGLGVLGGNGSMAADATRSKAQQAGSIADAGADGTKAETTDAAARSTAGTGSVRPGSSGIGAAGIERAGAKLEEETEVDILLARKRREANDRYFQRVNQGVLDVVAKLEEVAVAMRAVEQESKDMWGENESAPGSAKS